MFGEYVNARKFHSMTKELMIKASLLWRCGQVVKVQRNKCFVWAPIGIVLNLEGSSVGGIKKVLFGNPIRILQTAVYGFIVVAIR